MRIIRNISGLFRKVITVILTATLFWFPIALAAEGIINDDCTVNEAVFEREWRKYSDFDERIPPESRSWEVQQYTETHKRIDELNRESFMLQAEMEFDRHLRLELREVKESLVRNLRGNLVKSFFRLSFLTADAIKTGVNLGGTYAKLFTAGVLNALPEGLSYLKDAMDVVTGLTPDHGDSELAKEVKDRAGDFEDILKIADNPKNIAAIAVDRVKGKAEEKLGQLFPSV
ncbi:MAG: hypothetical protein NUK65_11180, partial [Firmicutes bacterium]|nr:hypothetical protein [Bacillota bacterium]